MSHVEKMYLIVLSSVFLFGCFIGAALNLAFSEDCKTRQELCSLDIKQIQLLKAQLTKSESSCLKLIDTSVSKAKKDLQLLCDEKFERIQDACNKLDCLQCEK